MSDSRGIFDAEVAAHMRRSEENATEAGVAAGLEDAKATLKEIWLRTLDDQQRHRAMRALEAVIAAEMTMRAADAFVRAETPKARHETFTKLRQTAILRVGHWARRTP